MFSKDGQPVECALFEDTIDEVCLNRIVDLPKTFTLLITYPLGTPYAKKVELELPIRIKDLIRLVDKTYIEIYRVENSSRNEPLMVHCPKCKLLDLNHYKCKFEYELFNIETCAICMSERLTSKIVLHCKHKYHFECLQKWFTQKNSCPLCKQPIIKCDFCNSSRRVSIWKAFGEPTEREPTIGPYQIGSLDYEQLKFSGFQYDKIGRILQPISVQTIPAYIFSFPSYIEDISNEQLQLDENIPIYIRYFPL